MRRLTLNIVLTGIALAVLLITLPGSVQAQDEATTNWRIHKAMLAAPASISAEATIYVREGENGEDWIVLREGTNGWGCFPGADDEMEPACWDPASVERQKARSRGEEVEFDGIAISYMLAGDEPHLMIYAGPEAVAGFDADEESGLPYAMGEGRGTHLMVPIR
jgi:hypothetical protein